jgi:hypothetical protein
MRALWRGFERKMPIFCPRSLWPAPHTPQQFSRKAQGTDHFLCAYWTAGFTARPPDIGSASFYTIFQAINRSSRCILDQSGGMS